MYAVKGFLKVNNHFLEVVIEVDCLDVGVNADTT